MLRSDVHYSREQLMEAALREASDDQLEAETHRRALEKLRRAEMERLVDELGKAPETVGGRLWRWLTSWRR